MVVLVWPLPGPVVVSDAAVAGGDGEAAVWMSGSLESGPALELLDLRGHRLLNQLGEVGVVGRRGGVGLASLRQHKIQPFDHAGCNQEGDGARHA